MKETTLKTIRKALCGVALGAGMAVIGGGAAHAQVIANNPSNAPFSVNAGIFVPSGKVVRRYAGDVLFAVEGNIRLQVLPESNSVTNLNVGYIGNNDKFKMVPLTVSQIFRNANNGSRYSYYYGVGAGAYITQLKDPALDEKTKGLFGGFLTVGVDGHGPLFGQLTYHYVAKYDDQFVGGAQVTVGIRL